MPRKKPLVVIDPKTMQDRKSTRLNSSHLVISYAVFCLKKKKRNHCSGSMHWQCFAQLGTLVVSAPHGATFLSRCSGLANPARTRTRLLRLHALTRHRTL